MKKNYNELITAMVAAIIALVFFIQSFNYSLTGPTGLGPGFFPIWLSGVFLFLSLIYVVQSIFRRKSSEDGVLPRGEALKILLTCLASMLLFAVVFHFLGFVIAGTVFLFILLFRAYKWYVNLGISLGTSLLLFWLFGSILNVNLPGIGL